MKGLYQMVLILVLIGLLLAACAPAEAPTPEGTATKAPAPATATPVPTPGPHGSLVIAGRVSLEMNPMNMIAAYSYGLPVFDGLVWPREKGVLEPRLATSWKLLDDNVTWEFKLREGVTFQNGEPFNAESVKYTVDKVLNEKLRWYSYVATIEEVKIVDDYTVHIVTYEPDPLLPGRLMLFMLPPKGVEEAGGLDEFSKKPVGTGPYMVDEFLPAERILYKYWPDSWRHGVVGVPDKPLEIEWIHMPDLAARMAALRAGDVDVILDMTFDQIEPLEKEGFTTSHSREASPSLVLLDMFSEDSPFRDKRVRHAVNYAIDKESLVNDLLLGVEVVPGQPVGPDGFGHNPDIEAYPYDPEKARQLLAEAGYPDGFDTTLECWAGYLSIGESAAEAVAAQLKKVGISVEIVPLEGAVWLQKLYGGGRAPMWMTWANYLPLYDADFSYRWFWGKAQPEPSRYMVHERFDELLAASRRELDSDKRLSMLQEMATIIHEEAPVVFLYFQGHVLAMNPRVKGLVIRADQMFYLDFVWLEE